MTGSGASVIVRARSATGRAVLMLVTVLSVRGASATPERTLQMWVCEPATVVITSKVSVKAVPGARLPRLQVTTLPATEQPLAGFIDTKFAPAAMRFVSTTLVAIAGPLLLTVSV